MSLLIKGVQVIDGTAKEPFKADVLVQGGLISSIGEIRGRKADQVLEGLGHYLAPGFIDPHSRSDQSLSIFSDREQGVFLEQGITTAIGGQQGFSLAPVVYGWVESVHRFADKSGLNTNWNTMREFLDELRRFRLGINFATLVGYANVRGDINGGRKVLHQKEAKVLHKVLKDAIRQGALGVSCDMGLMGSHKELNELIRLTGEQGAVCVVRISGQYTKAVKDVLEASKGSKARVVIDGLTPAKGLSKEFKDALALINKANEKHDLYRFIVQPHSVSEVHIRDFLPESLKHMSAQEALHKLSQVKYRNAAKGEWQGVDFRNVRVGSAPTRHYLAGKTVVEIANNWDSSYIEAMLRLMEQSGLKATLIYENINDTLRRGALSEKAALLTSNSDGLRTGGGAGVNEEALSAFPQYFRTVMSEGLVSIEEAVAKVTMNVAKYFNIPERGVLEEGRPADLVLLGKDDYGIRETILAGEIWGQERLKGQVIRRMKY